MARWLIVVAFLSLSACDALTEPKHATQVLTDAGYTDIKLTGYKFLACSKDDTYHTGFTAIGPTGRKVSGTVCAGFWFKNATIRFD